MFPKIVRQFDTFVVAELFADSKLPGKAAEHIALQVKLSGKNSQPLYLVMEPESGAVLREWTYSEGATVEGFGHELAEARKVFELLRN